VTAVTQSNVYKKYNKNTGLTNYSYDGSIHYKNNGSNPIIRIIGWWLIVLCTLLKNQIIQKQIIQKWAIKK